MLQLFVFNVAPRFRINEFLDSGYANRKLLMSRLILSKKFDSGSRVLCNIQIQVVYPLFVGYV